MIGIGPEAEGIIIDDELTALIHKVRVHRSEINICPSAKKGVVVGDLLKQIIEKKYILL